MHFDNNLIKLFCFNQIVVLDNTISKCVILTAHKMVPRVGVMPYC